MDSKKVGAAHSRRRQRFNVLAVRLVPDSAGDSVQFLRLGHVIDTLGIGTEAGWLRRSASGPA